MNTRILLAMPMALMTGPACAAIDARATSCAALTRLLSDPAIATIRVTATESCRLPPRIPSRRLTITGGDYTQAHLVGWQGVTFRDATFRSVEMNSDYAAALRLDQFRDIVIERSRFIGTRQPTPDAPGRRGGRGVLGVDGDGLTIRDNRFTSLNTGLIGGPMRRLSVVGNEFFDNSCDDIQLGRLTGARIAGNLMHGATPSPGQACHPDNIQISSNRPGEGSSDVVVENNTLISTPAGRKQGIFIATHQKTPQFRNVTVRGNLIVGSTWHGITVQNTEGVEVRGNRLVQRDGPDRVRSRLTVSASTGRVDDNEAPEVTAGSGTGRNRVRPGALRDDPVAAWRAAAVARGLVTER